MNISDFHMGRSNITDHSFQRGKKSKGFLAVAQKSAGKQARLSDNESDLLKFRVWRSMKT